QGTGLQNLNCPAALWPYKYNNNPNIVAIKDFDKHSNEIVCTAYPEPIKQAIFIPIDTMSKKGFMIAGASIHRRLDDNYLAFYEMLQTTLTGSLTKAAAYELQRKKTEELAEIDKAKTIFFNNVSHEFRTPLTLMLSPLEDVLSKTELS